MTKAMGCTIYFAGGEGITVTDSLSDVMDRVTAKEQFQVQVSTGYGYKRGVIVSKHVVGAVAN